MSSRIVERFDYIRNISGKLNSTKLSLRRSPFPVLITFNLLIIYSTRFDVGISGWNTSHPRRQTCKRMESTWEKDHSEVCGESTSSCNCAHWRRIGLLRNGPCTWYSVFLLCIKLVLSVIIFQSHRLFSLGY